MLSHLRALPRPLLGSLAALAVLIPASTQAADNAMKAKLEVLGQKFEIDKDGDFKMVFSFSEDKRSQVVYIAGTASELGPIKIREIFSPVAKLKDDKIGEKALQLLADNAKFKIGAFEVQGDFLVFNVKLNEDASGDQLWRAISSTAVLADEKEKELSGARDTF